MPKRLVLRLEVLSDFPTNISEFAVEELPAVRVLRPGITSR
jgi:hypothetical protein